MKKIALAFLSFFILFNSLNAQILKPVKWNWRAEKIDDNTYNLIFNAKIQETWSLYSQFIDDGGPVPTSFTFDPGSNYSLVGKTTESKNVETKFDKVFEMEIKKFHDYAEFVQKVKVSDKSKPITGYLSFMTCDDTRCLPPSDIDFSFDIAKWDEELQKSGSNNIKKKSEEPVKLETEKKVVEGNKTTSTAKDVEIKDGESTSNDESGSYDDFVEGGLLDAGSSESGNADPVGWDFEIEKISDDEFIIRFIAGIQKGWSIYSIYTEDNGPVPTEVYYEEKEGVVISEDAKETGHLKEGLDKMFGVNVKKFLHDQPYTIEQRVKVIDKTKPFKGTISYQACDDEKCVLLEENFAFDFDKGQAIEYVSQNVTVDSTMINPVTKHAFNKDRIEEECGYDTTTVSENKYNSWWLIFLAGFVGGLLAFLTPCVFPMVPLTVSYFTKRSGTRAKGIRNAIYYGLSIIVIYLILGLVITSIFGADALNQLSTNAWFNLFFAVLFIIFGISFFGFFEITLPSSWANKSDSMASKGGLLGIFFMAFTLALVSFSCTGPIIGTLLVQTATGDGPTILGSIPAGPLFGMLGFSTALALPFALFAMFPAWLNSLPKSGSWMNVIKVTLGFIEIALALKFISIADLTMGWKIMPYELFVGLWILVALAMTAYYFGWLRFPLDPPNQKISKTRKILGTITLIFALYFVSGFKVNKMSETFMTPNMLSGLAPPPGHSYILPKHCPLTFNCFHDFDKGLEYAKEVNKPILLDFTGYGCVNCRRMEDNVWSKDEVYNIIENDYVLISLYVDERKELEETYFSTFSNKEIKETGKKWADFQAIHFNTNSQPYYVLLSPDNVVLNKPVAYTPDLEQYKQFLLCGLERFKELEGEK